MKISEIGGEFELIRRVTEGKKIDPAVVKGIGDDCAVLELRGNTYQLVTTDMMVENDHFNLKWHSPYQVGMKLMEANVSDIICMGGTPKFAFLSMSLTGETSVEFMDGFYKGLYDSAEKHGVSLVGGDTTHGTELVFNIVLLGEVDKELLRLRSGGRPGDVICTTGLLGGSTAGLKLLLKEKEGFLGDHLEPKARTREEGLAIARYATAMIDVSDGLGSEVKHICNESGTGGEIDYHAIPMSPETIQAGKAIEEDPCDLALYGGEDFEIVFTIPEKNIESLKKDFTDFTIVGRILDKEEGVWLVRDGKRETLKQGYNHFA